MGLMVPDHPQVQKQERKVIDFCSSKFLTDVEVSICFTCINFFHSIQAIYLSIGDILVLQIRYCIQSVLDGPPVFDLGDRGYIVPNPAGPVFLS